MDTALASYGFGQTNDDGSFTYNQKFYGSNVYPQALAKIRAKALEQLVINPSRPDLAARTFSGLLDALMKKEE